MCTSHHCCRDRVLCITYLIQYMVCSKCSISGTDNDSKMEEEDCRKREIGWRQKDNIRDFVKGQIN